MRPMLSSITFLSNLDLIQASFKRQPAENAQNMKFQRTETSVDFREISSETLVSPSRVDNGKVVMFKM